MNIFSVMFFQYNGKTLYKIWGYENLFDMDKPLVVGMIKDLIEFKLTEQEIQYSFFNCKIVGLDEYELEKVA